MNPEPAKPPISITIDTHDFEMLILTGMRWADIDGSNSWRSEAARFETRFDNEEIGWGFEYILWIGQWSSLLLARAYLDSLGERYQVLFDTGADPDMQWVLLTSYMTPTWRHLSRSHPRHKRRIP